jgi:hypothetical protein
VRQSPAACRGRAKKQSCSEKPLMDTNRHECARRGKMAGKNNILSLIIDNLLE